MSTALAAVLPNHCMPSSRVLDTQPMEGGGACQQGPQQPGAAAREARVELMKCALQKVCVSKDYRNLEQPVREAPVELMKRAL